MVGDLKGEVVILLIVLALLCMPALGQKTSVDWDNKGVAFEAYGKYDEAIQAYDRAIDICSLLKSGSERLLVRRDRLTA